MQVIDREYAFLYHDGTGLSWYFVRANKGSKCGCSDFDDEKLITDAIMKYEPIYKATDLLVKMDPRHAINVAKKYMRFKGLKDDCIVDYYVLDAVVDDVTKQTKIK